MNKITTGLSQPLQRNDFILFCWGILALALLSLGLFLLTGIMLPAGLQTLITGGSIVSCIPILLGGKIYQTKQVTRNV